MAFQGSPGATQAYGWIHEDIDRLGWHGWLTAQDQTLVEERTSTDGSQSMAGRTALL